MIMMVVASLRFHNNLTHMSGARVKRSFSSRLATSINIIIDYRIIIFITQPLQYAVLYNVHVCVYVRYFLSLSRVPHHRLRRYPYELRR